MGLTSDSGIGTFSALGDAVSIWARKIFFAALPWTTAYWAAAFRVGLGSGGLLLGVVTAVCFLSADWVGYTG
ncbi:MAG: hypothetical protein WBB01_14560 [Phormidesmis sp.]